MKTRTLAFLILVSCPLFLALIPADQRQASFTLELKKLTKAKAFDSSSAWIAKNFGQGTHIDHKDRDAGRISGRAKMGCGALALAGQHTYSFTIDIRVKDGKVRITFEDVQMLPTDYQAGNPFAGLLMDRPDSEEDMTKVKNECLQPTAEELFADIRKEASDNF